MGLILVKWYIYLIVMNWCFVVLSAVYTLSMSSSVSSVQILFTLREASSFGSLESY